MPSFFDANVTETFTMYSTPHIAGVVALIAVLIGLYASRSVIRNDERLKRIVRYGILCLLAVPEICLYVWYAVNGLWDPRQTLPLELCSISAMLAVVMLWRRSKWLYPFVFFAGIGGAMQAILTPDLDFPYPYFRFFHFFIVHSSIIIAALYMTWIENMKPTWKSIKYVMLGLNAIALFVWFLNTILHSNYMFLMRKPESASLLDWLGPHPYYLIAEELVALCLFIVMYLLFVALPNRIANKR